MDQVAKKYKLVQLTSNRVPQAAKLLARSFLRQNTGWNIINTNLEKVEKYMIDKTLEMIDWQNELRENGVIGKNTYLNFIYVDQNDKIVFVNCNIELMQYLTKKSQVCFEEFNIFSKYYEEFEKSIDKRDKIQGLCFFNVFTAVTDQPQMRLGDKVQFAMGISRYLHAEGFRKMYGRSTNMKTYAFIMRRGQVISTIKIACNDKQLTLSLMKISLQPFKNDYSLSAMATFNAKL